MNINELPIRSQSHIVDSRAVATLRLAVAKKGWIFRELPVDYGVDAEIEVVDPLRGVTGALLRVQIKGSAHGADWVRLRSSTARYLLISPVPVLLVHINTTNGAIRCLMLEDRHLSSRKKHSYFIPISLAESVPLEKSWSLLKEIAIDHQFAITDIKNYTQYNPAAQLIRCTDLLLNFGGDCEAMLKWMRVHAPDEALTYNYGYAFQLKTQLEENPLLLDKLKLFVLDFFPEFKKRIDKAVALRKSPKSTLLVRRRSQ